MTKADLVTTVAQEAALAKRQAATALRIFMEVQHGKGSSVQRRWHGL